MIPTVHIFTLYCIFIPQDDRLRRKPISSSRKTTDCAARRKIALSLAAQIPLASSRLSALSGQMADQRTLADGNILTILPRGNTKILLLVHSAGSQTSRMDFFQSAAQSALNIQVILGFCAPNPELDWNDGDVILFPSMVKYRGVENHHASHLFNRLSLRIDINPGWTISALPSAIYVVVCQCELCKEFIEQSFYDSIEEYLAGLQQIHHYVPCRYVEESHNERRLAGYRTFSFNKQESKVLYLKQR